MANLHLEKYTEDWNIVRASLLKHGDKSVFCPGFISQEMRERFELDKAN